MFIGTSCKRTYSGGRLYQYNEDDFYLSFDCNKLYLNYKLISKQREAFFLNDSFSWLLCFCVLMLFKSLR